MSLTSRFAAIDEPSTRFVEERVNRPRNLILAVMFVILGAAFSAADIYIAPSAAGSANGASCSNAYAYTFFNTAGNWGSGASQIGAGTTVHLCSGTYSLTGGNNNGLSFQGGGTSGNPVTLIADQGAVTLTAASWETEAARASASSIRTATAISRSMEITS